jgi:hypothetical protein
MRLATKLILVSSGVLVAAGGFLLLGGVLSTRRDFSSPSASVQIIDQSGAPIDGVEVSRNWYDSDCGTEGSDRAVADQPGHFQFSKVPASVSLFTGAWRKTYSTLGMCDSGSGTYTKINVRFRGVYDVVPKGKTLHPVGQSHQDSDGVWFVADLDSNSNTMVSLSFPTNAKIIDYELSAKHHGE